MACETAVTDRVAAVFARAPFVRLLGYRLIDTGPGWVESALELEPRHLQQHGYVHAGVITTMGDHTSGGAASTMIPEGHSILTAQLSTHFLRPARGDQLTCRADVVKPGRTMVVTRADIHCDGTHVGLFHATMAVVQGDIA